MCRTIYTFYTGCEHCTTYIDHLYGHEQQYRSGYSDECEFADIAETEIDGVCSLCLQEVVFETIEEEGGAEKKGENTGIGRMETGVPEGDEVIAGNEVGSSGEIGLTTKDSMASKESRLESGQTLDVGDAEGK